MVLADLEKVVAKGQVERTEEFHPLGNDGAFVVFPRTEEDIISVLKFADGKRWKVNIQGNGSKRGFGGVSESADILLSLKKLSGIIEHSVGDMTMTVKPGTTMKEIRDFLKRHNQMVAVDPKWPEYATVGGVVASNDSGPKRLRYGASRDFVIGLRIVQPDGKVIRTGGKVVKNVAGYDMNKLFVGSMGTLGVISEITMKLRPIPKYESLLLLSFLKDDMETVEAFARHIQDTMLEPVSLELLSPHLSESMGGPHNYTLAIAFEDVEDAVHYQENWVEENRPEDTKVTILKGDEAGAWWDDFAKLPPVATIETDVEVMSLKVGSRNMDTIGIVHASVALGTEKGLFVKAHGGAGHGISRVFVTGNKEKFISFVNELRESVEQKGGYVVVDHMPPDLRKQLNVWGEKTTYQPLLEGIKRTFDPNGILNHKRFVGGL